MPFPAVKLVGLFIKQLSKPLAGYIKRKAKGSHILRTYICMPPAQLYHRMDVSLRMWSADSSRSKDFKVTPLKEDAAIDIGADLLGEIVIFTVSVGVIALEYWRQTANAAKKEQKQDDTLVLLRKEINELTRTVEMRQKSLDELTLILENYKSKDFQLVKADSKQDSQKLKTKVP